MQQDLSRRLVWVLGADTRGERLESVLAEVGAQCERFEHPEALWKRFEARRPDLVLGSTDSLAAPGALERFVETLRRRAEVPVPLVAVTADGSVEMRRRMFKAGIDDFVLEPVVPSELVARVGAQLRLNRTRPGPPSLPRQAASAVHNDGGSGPSLAATAAGAPVDDAALSVLVVDDEEIIHRVLRSAFERRGWTVTQANDGREALDRAAKRQFDLVVFDLNLPFKNGFELLGELGGAAAAKRPYMVVLSAEGQQESVVRAFELGADDFVSKPVNPDILVARIARLVRPAAGQ
ncbi:response regulator [Persicimonas caeni]|nr:response regulator [Persicimonas caeni]